MATFTASPTSVQALVTRSDVYSVVSQLTITGSADPGVPITLTKAGAVAWLTIPATCLHGVAFDVEVDIEKLTGSRVTYQPAAVTETIEVTSGVYTQLDVAVSVMVQPAQIPNDV